MNLLKIMLFAAALLTGSVALAEVQSESTMEAEELLNVVGMEATLYQSMSQMVDAQVQQNPTLEPFKKVMLAFFGKYMSYASLKSEMVKGYSEAFTVSELQELNTFYGSDLGQKAAKKMPEVLAQAAKIGVSRVQANMPELQTMMKAEAERLQALQKQIVPEEKP